MIFFNRLQFGIFLAQSVITTSCEFSTFDGWNDPGKPSFNAEDRLTEEIKLKLARRSLYENDLEKCDSLLNLVDTVRLSNSGLGFYFLTKGFADHKNGDTESSIRNMEGASRIISKYGEEEDRAELELILGLIFEDSYLLSDAAKSFFTALDYYQNHTQLPEYFYTLLGLARTAPLKENFLKDAEIFLLKNSSNRYLVFFYQTMAICTDNLSERQHMFLKALEYNSEYKDIRSELNIYTSLALNSFMLDHADSALFYMERADKLVNLSKVPRKRLVHYYLIKTYINVEMDNLEVATQAVDTAIFNATGLHGLLRQAYRQKYFIESKYKNYRKANEFLLKYIIYKKKELESMQENQLSLLSIQHGLQLKEAEIERIKRYWLVVSLILIILFAGIGIVFMVYRKRATSLIKDLKFRLNITSNRLQEQIVHRVEDIKATSKGKVRVSGPNQNIYKKGDWPSFVSVFQIRHPLFEEKLKKTYPKLSATDIKYCVCFFSGLSNFQTGELLGVSSDAVRKAKKKLQLLFKMDKPGEVVLHLKKVDRKSMTPPSGEK